MEINKCQTLIEQDQKGRDPTPGVAWGHAAKVMILLKMPRWIVASDGEGAGVVGADVAGEGVGKVAE